MWFFGNEFRIEFYALEMFVFKEKEKLEYLVKLPTLRERIELPTMN